MRGTLLFLSVAASFVGTLQASRVPGVSISAPLTFATSSVLQLVSASQDIPKASSLDGKTKRLVFEDKPPREKQLSVTNSSKSGETTLPEHVPDREAFWGWLLRNINEGKEHLVPTVIVNWEERPSNFFKDLDEKGAKTLVKVLDRDYKPKFFNIDAFIDDIKPEEVRQSSLGVCTAFVKFAGWLKHADQIQHEECYETFFKYLVEESYEVSKRTALASKIFAEKYADGILTLIKKDLERDLFSVTKDALNALFSNAEVVKKHFTLEQLFEIDSGRLFQITPETMAIIASIKELNFLSEETDVSAKLKPFCPEILAAYNGPLHCDTLKNLEGDKLGHIGEKLEGPVCQQYDLTVIHKDRLEFIPILCLVGYFSKFPKPALGFDKLSMKQLDEIAKSKYLPDIIANMDDFNFKLLPLPILKTCLENFSILDKRSPEEWLMLESNESLPKIKLTLDILSALLQYSADLTKLVLSRVGDFPDDVFNQCDIKALLKHTTIEFLGKCVDRCKNAREIGRNLSEKTPFCSFLSEDEYKSLWWLRASLGPMGRQNITFRPANPDRFPELSDEKDVWRQYLEHDAPMMDAGMLAVFSQNEKFCAGLALNPRVLHRIDNDYFYFMDSLCILAINSQLPPGAITKLHPTAFSKFKANDFKSLIEKFDLTNFRSSQLRSFPADGWSDVSIEKINRLGSKDHILSAEALAQLKNVDKLDPEFLKDLTPEDYVVVRKLIKPEMFESLPSDAFSHFDADNFAECADSKLSNLTLEQIESLGICRPKGKEHPVERISTEEISKLDFDRFRAVMKHHREYLKDLSGLERELPLELDPESIHQLRDAINPKSIKNLPDNAFVRFTAKELAKFKIENFRKEQLEALSHKVLSVFYPEDLIDRGLESAGAFVAKSCERIQRNLKNRNDFENMADDLLSKIQDEKMNFGDACNILKLNFVFSERPKRLFESFHKNTLIFCSARDIYDLLPYAQLKDKYGWGKDDREITFNFDNDEDFLAESIQWIEDHPEQIIRYNGVIKKEADDEKPLETKKEWTFRLLKHIKDKLTISLTEDENGPRKFNVLCDSKVGRQVGMLLGVAIALRNKAPLEPNPLNLDPEFLKLILLDTFDISRIIQYFEETYKDGLEPGEVPEFIGLDGNGKIPVSKEQPRNQLCANFIEFVFEFYGGLNSVFPLELVRFAPENVRKSIHIDLLLPPALDDRRVKEITNPKVVSSLIPGYGLTVGRIFDSFIKALNPEQRKRLGKQLELEESVEPKRKNFKCILNHEEESFMYGVYSDLWPIPESKYKDGLPSGYLYREKPDVVISRGEEYMDFIKKVVANQRKILKLPPVKDIDVSYYQDSHYIKFASVDFDVGRAEVVKQPAVMLLQTFVCILNGQAREW